MFIKLYLVIKVCFFGYDESYFKSNLYINNISKEYVINSPVKELLKHNWNTAGKFKTIFYLLYLPLDNRRGLL